MLEVLGGLNMKAASLITVVASLLVGACSSSDDRGDDRVAGGQSGTDSSGAYDCDIENATSEDIALDEVFNPSWGRCTALDSVAIQQPVTTFDCGELGPLSLSVGEPTAAQRLTGVTYNDTGDPGPGADCYALRVEAPVHIASPDGGISFDGASYTLRYSCGWLELDGAYRDAQGRTMKFGVAAENVQGADGAPGYARQLQVAVAGQVRVDCRPLGSE